jgi:adenylate cyclase
LPHTRVYMPIGADQALPLLHRALSLQPDYPAAQAAAALCHEVRYMRGGMQQADKEAALNHARAAIEGGADDAETLATAGFVIGLVAHDYDTAMNAIDRALLINATSAYALGWGAVILGHAGRAEQGVEYAERALRLSPLDPGIGHHYSGLGIAYCAARNWEGVAAACGKAIQAMPRFSLSYFLQAAALSELGRVAEATSVARRGLELEPGFTVSGFVRAHTGRAEIWEPIGDALRQLGLPE